MSEAAPEPKEGWAVPLRLPMIAMVFTVLILSVALLASGYVYRKLLRARTEPPALHFPSPRLELTQTPPDILRQDYRQPAPANIDKAMDESAAAGNALWQDGDQ